MTDGRGPWPGMRVATAPVNWNNDDVPDLRPHVDHRRMLREMRAAGYDATEYSAALPSEAGALQAALDEAGLTLVGAFCPVPLDEPDALARHGPRIDRLAGLLAAVGCDLLVLADAIRPERSAWTGRATAPGAPRLDGARRRTFLDNVHAIGRHLAERGTRIAFHHHAATYVEAPDEVRWLMDESDPELVGLCLDTGHLTYGGGDAVEFARAYGGRVRHVHLKDVDRTLLARAREEGWSFEHGLRSYMFPTLGDGVVDFTGVLSALRDAGYQGWLVVEQDTQPVEPLAAARANRRYLADAFGL
jgi:inosose dehydratase